MIMDEVLAVGDMAFQKKCLDKMRDAAKKEGRTVLYVSHNMNTIRQLCDRCVVLDQGKVVFEGDVEEAIGRYLNSGKAEESPNIVLEHRERPSVSTNKAHIIRLDYCGRENCIFTRGEKLSFQLRWKAQTSLEGVKFRMIVRFSDDSAVGLVQSDYLGDYRQGEEVTNTFRFDTSMLAEGRYYFSIALFQADEIGNSIILDHITRACLIDIISPTDNKNLLNWEHRWWGSIRFPDLEIVKQEDS